MGIFFCCEGKLYKFFKDNNVDTCRKKWYDLLTLSTYNWFWDVYIYHIDLTTLSEEQIVILNDIFDIIKFLNPMAIKILSSEDSTIEKYIFIREKARTCEPWVETRHHLYYA